MIFMKKKIFKFISVITLILLIVSFSYFFSDIHLVKNGSFILRRIRGDLSLRRVVLKGIGVRLKKARSSMGWSQERLAEELTKKLKEQDLLGVEKKIYQVQISEWENEKKFPEPKKLPVLAEILGLDVYVLLTGKKKEEILKQVGGIAEDIGERILIARVANGWTGGELERKMTEELRKRGLLGVEREILGEVSHWEKGIQFPNPNRLPVLAEILGLDVYVLLTGKEKEEILKQVGGIAENIGKRILITRLANGWTMQQLARKMTEKLTSLGLLKGEKISKSRISQWENNIYLPESAKIPVLSYTLGLDKYQLLFGKFKQSLSDISNIGLRIKVARLANGLYQRELAEKINIPVWKIKKWESGAIIPSEEEIQSLARVLNLEVSHLTKSEDKK